jgi:CDP-diacylglycerol--serine O-phosphatidyltransferase
MLGAVLGGNCAAAGSLLLWALLLDGLAGQAARKGKDESELGAELDSLAALIAFGIAVMVLAFEQSLRFLGPLGWVLSVGVAVSVALRLSRDNQANPDWPRYQGLPVPAFGAALGLLSLQDCPPLLLAAAAFSLAVLMLAPLSYARLSQSPMVQAGMGGLLMLAVALPAARLLVLWIALLYALGGAFFDFGGLLQPAAVKKIPRRRKARS